MIWGLKECLPGDADNAFDEVENTGSDEPHPEGRRLQKSRRSMSQKTRKEYYKQMMRVPKDFEIPASDTFDGSAVHDD